MFRKKIFFATNIPSPYNLDLYKYLSDHFDLSVCYYAKSEAERNWSINISSPKYISFILKSDIFHLLFQKVNRNLYFNLQIFRIALHTNYDYYILSGNYFAPNTIILLFILGFRKKKIFWNGERLMPSENIFKIVFKNLAIRYLSYFTKAALIVGEKSKISYINYGYKKDLHNTPYSVDNSVYITQEGFESKRDKKLIFLSVGSLIERKGYDIAIKAFNLLQCDIKKLIEYWIIGDGPLLSQLRAIVNSDLHVKFLGHIEPTDLIRYYKTADCFIHTSRYDGWGVVVNEALSAGLPVIVTENSGVSEYICDESGFIIKADVDSLKEKIEYIFNNRSKIQVISKFNLSFSNKINSENIARIMSNYILQY